MASEPLLHMPAQLVIGDSLRLRVPASAEYSVAEWTPDLVLLGPTQTSLGLQVEADGWLFTLMAGADDFEAGWYGWTLRMLSSDETERRTIASGRIEFVPDPAGVEPPSEQRSFARRELDAIEAVMLKRGAVLSFSAFGRSYSFESKDALYSYRNRLRAEVAAEDEAARRARGEPSHSVAWVRFSRP